MIYKSYLVEENIDLLKNNLILFYGENLGLKNDLRMIIKKKFRNSKILRYSQEDVLKNYDTFVNEIRNISLFENQKVFIVDHVNDKILKLIEEMQPLIDDSKIFLFGEILEKKSKLRSFFEKSKNTDVVPCYKDNEINLKKIISVKLNGYRGVTTKLINMLVDNCSMDRVRLNNELDKIATFFSDKVIEINLLEIMLNEKVDEDFDSIKDSALNGNKIVTNKLLSSTMFEPEKNIYYLNTINQRLSKLREVALLSNDKKDTSEVINNLRPPIFWKDKPNFIMQTKKWNENMLNKALKKTYEIEIKMKSSSNVNNNVLMKKLLIDVCYLANAS